MKPSAIVFDLFHTLVDTEHLRPSGFDELDAVAHLCGIDVEPARRFWASTYVERETTPIDLVDLLARHLVSVDASVSPGGRRELDAVFGVTKDEALRRPRTDVVRLVDRVARLAPVGVLSNCHEREVRCWPESPFARSVAAFGRSSRIGAMKPDAAAYQWILTRLGADPTRAVYVGNGSSDELLGARRAGFGTVIHSNVFDRDNGLVEPDEQRRRAGQADASVDSIAELSEILEPA